MFGHKNEELIACQDCGQLFPKSKLKKCKQCGDVLCPKCRKKHHCNEMQSESASRRSDTEKWFGGTETRNNPQCVIKMTDMRIYEIANNPNVMTQYEEFLIDSDPDIRRRYEHYRTVIQNEGR